MSRIIVKNIGQHTTEKQLKDLFSSKGEVTDVRIIKTSSGKSRQFAFVGFRNEQQSKDAQSYFNNSFLHTSKLTVDIAKAVGDKSLEHDTKSRYTKNKLEKAKKAADKIAKKELEEKKKLEEETRRAERKNKAAQDSKTNKHKGEFMEVMKSRQQAHIWGNDTKDQNQVPPPRRGTESSDEEGSDVYESESDDGISKGRGRISKTHRTAQASDSDSSDSESDDDDDDSVSGDEHEAQKSNSGTAAMSDMDYLRSKMVKKKEITVSDSDSGNDSDGNDSDSENKGEHENDDEEAGDDNVDGGQDTGPNKDSPDIKEDEDESIDEDGRLFIRNIPFSCVEDEILQLFSVYGTVSQVHLPLDADKKCKGFGFVQFMLPEDANRALQALDGSSFQGRLLHIMLAKQQTTKTDTDEGFESKNSHLSSFQQKREAERRKMAHKRDGWNASFVRSDAVVDALSDKYGVARGDILDTDGVGGGEMAVRLAIGETHVIQENQEYFASHGVDIQVLESALRRGKSDKKAKGSNKSGEESKV
jgi:multiple RNA-binding domain-containing protein 1